MKFRIIQTKSKIVEPSEAKDYKAYYLKEGNLSIRHLIGGVCIILPNPEVEDRLIYFPTRDVVYSLGRDIRLEEITPGTVVEMEV